MCYSRAAERAAERLACEQSPGERPAGAAALERRRGRARRVLLAVVDEDQRRAWVRPVAWRGLADAEDAPDGDAERARQCLRLLRVENQRPDAELGCDCRAGAAAAAVLQRPAADLDHRARGTAVGAGADALVADVAALAGDGTGAALRGRGTERQQAQRGGEDEDEVLHRSDPFVA